MKDVLNALLVAVLVIFLAFVFVSAVGKYHDCEAKGGAYVQGQCLKVEVLK